MHRVEIDIEIERRVPPGPVTLRRHVPLVGTGIGTDDLRKKEQRGDC